jgi:hypothetical protein
MSELRPPRKPLRPEPYQTDWSPRPIPQPAPERRTADPKTPKLRELAARERQRASVVAQPDATYVARRAVPAVARSGETA